MTKQTPLRDLAQLVETHRTTLGDKATDELVALVHEKLARDERDNSTTHQRRLVSILFVDVVSSTKTFEKLDPEDVLAIMDESLHMFGDSVVRHGGMVARLFGDALLAFFGVPTSYEDDSERAIKAGLDILKDAISQNETLTKLYPIPKFDVRVGVNTGLVALGEVGGAGMEYTAMGDAINIAKHTESAAPEGGLLITHDTYRHVEGAFDVEKAEKLQFKGREQLTQTYVVHRAKPRGFRAIKRTIEGVEIPLIGRKDEMALLKDAYTKSAHHNETHLVILQGNAGVGKSRLLSEFDVWVEAHPENVYYLSCSAFPQTERVPYNIFHDLFSLLLGITDRDSQETLWQKFETEVGELIGTSKAHIMADVLGFEFTQSPYVQEVLALDEDLKALGYQYLADFFAAACGCHLDGSVLPGKEREVTLVFIEDLHWVDEASLELLQFLISATYNIPLMFLAGTRPSFYERHPSWEDDREGVTHINLPPLTEAESIEMVSIMLQRVENNKVGQITKMIVKNADGNPFYIEEMLKMMIEEGVIIKGEEHWWIEEARLQAMRVPPTLAGILQARLDKLPAAEKLLLQRASVVGPVFWDDLIDNLTGESDVNFGIVPEFLKDLQQHELILLHPESMFEDTTEYMFKSAIVREVVYDSVLKRDRNTYHRQVAEWLEEHSGDRHNEYVSLIAEHYIAAGDTEKAKTYLEEAAEFALGTGDGGSAARHLERLLDLLAKDNDTEAVIECTLKLAKVHNRSGNISAAENVLKRELELIHEFGDDAKIATMLSSLAEIYVSRGDYDRARELLTEAKGYAESSGNGAAEGTVMKWMGTLEQRAGAYKLAREHYVSSLTSFGKGNSTSGQADVLRKMAVIARLEGDYRASQELLEQGIAIADQGDHFWAKADILHSLGELFRAQEDYAQANRYYEEALTLAESLNDRELMAVIDLNRGHAATASGAYDDAMRFYYDSMENAKRLGIRPVKIHALAGMARVRAHQGNYEEALKWLGIVERQPALDVRIRQTSEIALSMIREKLSDDDVETGLNASQDMSLELTVKQRLEQREAELSQPIDTFR